VAISGDTAIVGGGSGSGSTYIFQQDTFNNFWYQHQKLTADDGAAGDYFGWSVAISGDTVVISAPLDDDGGNSSGSAYIFQRNSGIWSQYQKLTADDGAAYDHFGTSVAISGDTAIIGAQYDDDVSGLFIGSAYIFQRDSGTWSQDQKLTDDGAVYEHFGSTVAISGDTAIVGAQFNNDMGDESGSVYLFQRDEGLWSQVQKLSADDGATNDLFGSSVNDRKINLRQQCQKCTNKGKILQIR